MAIFSKKKLNNMLSHCYFRCSCYEPVQLKHDTMLLVPSQIESNGSFSRSSEFRKVTVEDNFKEFTSDDFKISSLLAVGATNMLKPVSMVNHDYVGLSDGLDRLNESVSVDNP